MIIKDYEESKSKFTKKKAKSCLKGVSNAQVETDHGQNFQKIKSIDSQIRTDSFKIQDHKRHLRIRNFANGDTEFNFEPGIGMQAMQMLSAVSEGARLDRPFTQPA
jgi:hypothetical protein